MRLDSSSAGSMNELMLGDVRMPPGDGGGSGETFDEPPATEDEPDTATDGIAIEGGRMLVVLTGAIDDELSSSEKSSSTASMTASRRTVLTLVDLISSVKILR